MYTYTHIHIYTFTHIHIYTYTHMHIYTYTHVYLYTYTHIHITGVSNQALRATKRTRRSLGSREQRDVNTARDHSWTNIPKWPQFHLLKR